MAFYKKKKKINNRGKLLKVVVEVLIYQSLASAHHSSPVQVRHIMYYYNIQI